MAKPKKNAHQLRLMILTELRSSTPFPAGFDVKVQPGKFGWEARCVPPPGVISYADCSEAVRSVGKSISAKFDLET